MTKWYKNNAATTLVIKTTSRVSGKFQSENTWWILQLLMNYSFEKYTKVAEHRGNKGSTLFERK